MESATRPAIIYPRTPDEVHAAYLRLVAYYQRSGRFPPESRAVLQGVLETLKWVMHMDGGEHSRINQLLTGVRLPEHEVPNIKPPTGG